jgi:uncharacterized protein
MSFFSMKPSDLLSNLSSPKPTMAHAKKSTRGAMTILFKAGCVAGFISLNAWAQPAASTSEFFTAVQRNQAAKVGEMLQKGTDPNSLNDKGNTGFYVAMQEEALASAQSLLNAKNFDSNRPNDKGETPLMMSALKGHLDLTQILLRQGAQINKSGWGPLHYAVSGPSFPVVELLVKQGADIEARSPNGTTPLMMAARYGDESSVDLLLRQGADKTKRNDLKLTAADFARQAGRDKLVQRLQ